jgi:hypothetical protein
MSGQRRKSAWFLGLAILGVCWAAAGRAQPAQPPAQPKNDASVETVIVTGERAAATPDTIAHDVIRSIALPSTLRGTIARWRYGLCPRTDGLSSRTLNNYVTARIREIASETGAPLAGEPCQPNMEVMFTDDPQAMLEAVHKANAAILGYHPAASVSHPVQAWYETGTTDIDGNTVVDEDVSGHIEIVGGGGFAASGGAYGAPAVQGPVNTFGIPHAYIQGWRGRPEVSSDILGVFIIADSRQTANFKLGPVADYLALLTLSQTQAYDDCQVVPSIANLMAPNCDARLKPDQISASDIGFLRGLYKMDPGASLQVQQDQIAGEMAKTFQVKTSGDRQ